MTPPDGDFTAARIAIDSALEPPALEPQPGPRGLVRRALLRLTRPRARYQQGIDRRLLGLIEALNAEKASEPALDSLREWLHNTDAHVESQARMVEELRTWNTDLAGRLDGAAQRVAELSERLARIEPFVASSRAAPEPSSIGLEQYEVEHAGTVLGYRDGASGVGPEDDYLAFEDVFRLSEDIIRERQRPYLALVGDRAPVLDVGCGRGEFLELLRDAGIEGTGVDLDPGMVGRARAKGLTVHEGDGVAYLASVADASLGVVFAAQVVEHLPYERLMTFLRLSAVKLKPGGRLIAETVNPHAPGALKNFWFDLTHQHPVFPEVLLTLCRSIGYGTAFVFHPGGSGDVRADREHCGDYALVAERASDR